VARAGFGGVRAGCWCGGRRVAVWVAVDPARFLLDQERATAWGLDPNLDLVRGGPLLSFHNPHVFLLCF
jgi:hypothetical protein